MGGLPVCRKRRPDWLKMIGTLRNFLPPSKSRTPSNTSNALGAASAASRGVQGGVPLGSQAPVCRSCASIN